MLYSNGEAPIGTNFASGGRPRGPLAGPFSPGYCRATGQVGSIPATRDAAAYSYWPPCNIDQGV